MDEMITLEGEVFSGEGKGEYYINLPWVKNQIFKKLGFSPYKGTLNLKLSDKVDIQKLHRSEGIRIKPKPGYCAGKLFQAVVMKKIQGAVILPIVPKYPNDILEIIAPISLRETLELSNGDMINVTIKIQ